jgi:hypothetical protein
MKRTRTSPPSLPPMSRPILLECATRGDSDSVLLVQTGSPAAAGPGPSVRCPRTGETTDVAACHMCRFLTRWSVDEEVPWIACAPPAGART